MKTQATDHSFLLASLLRDEITPYFEKHNVQTDIKETMLIIKGTSIGEVGPIFLPIEFYRYNIRNRVIELFSAKRKQFEFEILGSSKNTVRVIDGYLVFNFEPNQNFEVIIRTSRFLTMRPVFPQTFESKFSMHDQVKYKFIPARDEAFSKDLIVVFSAMGRPHQYNFNYMKSFKDHPANQLFILDDFGEKGSYYLGKDLSFRNETSVISLIMNILHRIHATPKHVTTFGSSKGGYVALYYALKYGFGEVVSLAPSINLGDFLISQHPDLLEYMTGGSQSYHVYEMNQLIYDLVREKRDEMPYIHLMVGTADSRKLEHLDPFVSYLESLDIPFDYHIVEGVDHSELKFFAPQYIDYYFSRKFSLKSSLLYFFVMNEQFLVENDQIVFKMNVVTDESTEVAFYWYMNDQIYKKTPYSNDLETKIPYESGNQYRVKIFIRNRIAQDQKVIFNRTFTSET
ncbi:hypothetical protein [Exiguobacterium sp. s152]|uniref:hypothetical protein n=1 Tax=Exiguobacterium sp. s152 TaxID=2751226 RepID=UPI001BE9633E|nr:hypothetical protein [Exiguobacterium sp. s152]